MPYHRASDGQGAGTGAGGFRLPRVAGWSLLTGGVLIALALVLTSVARSRREGYADLDW
jgi:hypothetical protein